MHAVRNDGAMTVTPYFEQDGVTLYHGDCREILPGLGRFDLLLTDPPYGINENTTKQQSRQGHGLASQKNYGTYDNNRSCEHVGLATTKEDVSHPPIHVASSTNRRQHHSTSDFSKLFFAV